MPPPKKGRDLALSRSNLSAQPIIARARYAYYYSLFKQRKVRLLHFLFLKVLFLDICSNYAVFWVCFAVAKLQVDLLADLDK